VLDYSRRTPSELNSMRVSGMREIRIEGLPHHVVMEPRCRRTLDVDSGTPAQRLVLQEKAVGDLWSPAEDLSAPTPVRLTSGNTQTPDDRRASIEPENRGRTFRVDDAAVQTSPEHDYIRRNRERKGLGVRSRSICAGRDPHRVTRRGSRQCGSDRRELCGDGARAGPRGLRGTQRHAQEKDKRPRSPDRDVHSFVQGRGQDMGPRV
jgi:hypothetical protein